jgi:hypothetical protein
MKLIDKLGAYLQLNNNYPSNICYTLPISNLYLYLNSKL